MPHSSSTLHLTIADGVATIVLDNPPVNVLSATMMKDLHTVLGELRDDDAVRVIVFSSANPDFFIAHADLRIFEEQDLFDELAAAAPEGVNVYQAVGELLRNQPQPIIVKLAGKTRGGGAEFVAAADIVFAATETAGLGQIESLMGIAPGGGGTQYLSERVGRNRAMEIILTGELYDATTAAAYGWVNRAVPAAEIDAFVDEFARNIANLADGVARGVKQILSPTPPIEGYKREQTMLADLLARPTVIPLMMKGLEQGVQTLEGEKQLEQLVRSVTL